MSYVPKLAIFDVDGTLAERGVVPQSVLEGIKNLHDKGCSTTVSTGRGFVRLKEALGSYLASL
jgi:hydroxymethylpyrimidine pyrophosphatase-like HAD family hydrolase